MAIVTHPLVTFYGATEATFCRFEIDYDDATLLVRVLRAVSTFLGTAAGEVRRLSDGRVYGTTFPSGTTAFTLPQSGPNRLFLTEVAPLRGFATTFTPPEA